MRRWRRAWANGRGSRGTFHDTLLQSFHGLLLRFGIVDRLLPSRAEEAKGELQRAMELATAAITEGRDAVQALRVSVTQTNYLAEAFNTLAKELAADAAGPKVPAFRLDIGGG